ncbi:MULTISPECIES: SixA phosphatase family protein [unclassified Corynebacterium]|uniref:SixA phosphatase family protein n=1 Tax=unclassified Corynebacterium TaxID=2624378 RepID=UPI0030B46FB9
MSAKTLIVMRHAKSSWKTGKPDFQRPLNKRGRRDAPAAGAWLGKRWDIERVLCSSSARTRETWARAVDGGARAQEVTFHDEIYEVNGAENIELARTLPESVSVALLLGHFPGVEEMVREIAAEDDHPGWAQMDVKFPTSAIAVVEFEGEWAKLGAQKAKLVEYVVPRG